MGTLFTLNVDEIIEVIANLSISPSAREQAAELVEAWINEHSAFDLSLKTVAVEVPWFYWLQPKRTVIIGVMDRLARDTAGVFGCEWKSAKEPQRNADGRDSAWWNESVWLESISQGTQLSIYALALHHGTFVPRGTKGPGWTPNIATPRIMVRAAVKSSPPRFWPIDPKDGVFEFPASYLEEVVAPALISKAEQIRAARALTTVPWSLPGNHCYNRFRRECPYHHLCLAHNHPSGPPRQIFDMDDPGSQALLASGAGALSRDPNLVIFSASSYDTSQQCIERYRILTGGFAPKEEDTALDVGTGLHAGVASLYQQQMRYQNAKARRNKTSR